MKKLASLILALTLCLSLTTVAFAADTAPASLEDAKKCVKAHLEGVPYEDFIPMSDTVLYEGDEWIEENVSAFIVKEGQSVVLNNTGYDKDCAVSVTARLYMRDGRMVMPDYIWTGNGFIAASVEPEAKYIASGESAKFGWTDLQAVRKAYVDRSFDFETVDDLNEVVKLIVYMQWPDNYYWLSWNIDCGSSDIYEKQLKEYEREHGLESKTNFSDVPKSAYYAEPVQWAISNSITNGTSNTTFSPDDTCTTAQILTFLHRAKGTPAPTQSNPYSDVKSGDYFYNAALWAGENGLTGNSGGFNGGTPCTRAAVVTYLWKLAGRPSAGNAGFSDVPASADYAQAVAWAVAQGITNGTGDTTFSPDATCTRGQIVTFLYRAYAK